MTRIRGSGFQTRGAKKCQGRIMAGLEQHIEEKNRSIMRNLLLQTVNDMQAQEGLSDGQMAAKLGCSRQLWQMTRTGQRAISVTLLKCIARNIPELQAAIMDFLKVDGEADSMKLVYGVSRWTNASRPAARHIDDGNGKPLCGGRGRKAFSWVTEEGQPTCQRCMDIWKERDNAAENHKEASGQHH